MWYQWEPTDKLLQESNGKYTEGNDEERKEIVRETVKKIEDLLFMLWWEENRWNRNKQIVKTFTECVLFFKRNFDGNESKNEFAGKILWHFLNKYFDKLFKLVPHYYKRTGNKFSSKTIDDLYEALLNNEKIEEEKMKKTDEELRKNRKEEEKKKLLIEKNEKEKKDKADFLELVKNLTEKNELKKEQRRNIEELLQKHWLEVAKQKLQVILHPNRDA